MLPHGKTLRLWYIHRMTLKRVTINLTEKSVRALDELCATTADSKTDVINRALQTMNLIDSISSKGGRLYLLDGDGGELERLRIL